MKANFGRWLFKLENRFDILKSWIKNKRKNFDPIQVLPYIGYGSKNIFRIKGRVLESKGITGALPGDNKWKNLSNMYKRFESDEVQGVTLNIKYGKQVLSVITDEEGYFEMDFNPAEVPDETSAWQELEIEITNAPIPHTPGIKYLQKVLYPPDNCEYGIISDIDDTIVKTNATSLLKMFTTTIFNNAASRIPFEGVSSFYLALQKGCRNSFNPVFYVSSSPWNLYDLLIEFLETHKIPTGPLLLKDYGIKESSMLSSGHHAHKYFQIERILQTYPSLKFILIGDSGQEDAAIYSQIIKDFPDRILTAYIRDLNIPKHRTKVLEIQEGLKHHTVPMLLTRDSLAAAEHALQMNFILQEELEQIRNEVNKDQKSMF